MIFEPTRLVDESTQFSVGRNVAFYNFVLRDRVSSIFLGVTRFSFESTQKYLELTRSKAIETSLLFSEMESTQFSFESA